MGSGMHDFDERLMLPLWEATYIVIDVETTGSNPAEHRIIEIGCVVVKSGEVVARIGSLVKPHQFIPPFITQLTGISNADVYHAPEEHDVLPVIADMLCEPAAVFVAHHEQFDWRFLTHALLRCGYDEPTLPRLCTYRLARRLLPAHRKKNLGAVAEYFGIVPEQRHRALGDAMTAARVLVCLLEELEERYNMETLEQVLHFQHSHSVSSVVPKRVRSAVQSQLEALPTLPGVYKMFNRQQELLYIGKAKVLAERVRSYFQPGALLPQHVEQMVRQVHHIEWEETATELAALLREAELIAQHKPPFNILQRRQRRHPFLRLTDEQFPRLELVTQHDGNGEYFGPFYRRGTAEMLQNIIGEQFHLRRCTGQLAPSISARPCFYYHIRQCKAPCAMLQSEQEYREEVQRVREVLHGGAHRLILQLEEEMHRAAEQLDFERAQQLLTRLRELKTLTSRLPLPSATVTGFTAGLFVPTAYEAGTIELFLFIGGKLICQRVVGRKSSLGFLQELLPSDVSVLLKQPLSVEQVRVLRIVTSWMYQNAGSYKLEAFDPSVCAASAIVEHLEQALHMAEDDGGKGNTYQHYVPLDQER